MPKRNIIIVQYQIAGNYTFTFVIVNLIIDELSLYFFAYAAEADARIVYFIFSNCRRAGLMQKDVAFRIMMDFIFFYDSLPAIVSVCIKVLFRALFFERYM